MYTFERIVSINRTIHQRPFIGEVIVFERDHFTIYSENSIRAMNKQKQIVGYLNNRAARRFSPLMDQGKILIVGEVVSVNFKCYWVKIFVEEIQ